MSCTTTNLQVQNTVVNIVGGEGRGGFFSVLIQTMFFFAQTDIVVHREVTLPKTSLYFC